MKCCARHGIYNLFGSNCANLSCLDTLVSAAQRMRMSRIGNLKVIYSKHQVIACFPHIVAEVPMVTQRVLQQEHVCIISIIFGQRDRVSLERIQRKARSSRPTIRHSLYPKK